MARMDLSHRSHQRGPECVLAPGHDGVAVAKPCAGASQILAAASREMHSLMPDGLQVAFRNDNGKRGRGRATGEGLARL
ncbi:MAG: hypothetical protein JW986_08575 [Methanotrichaceae archaeon]|nr:hypothetical protein [Methanotrichaceae archaeon]